MYTIYPFSFLDICNALFMARCDSPFYVLPKAGTEKVPVPCGRCPPCKQRRVEQWVFRVMKETERHMFAHFVTLTYDTTHVPISENGFMTLKPKDLQDYWKRLRKLCSGSTLKYYAVGEYGSTSLRPHYHAIVFGVDDTTKYVEAWSYDKIYQYGSVHVGQVSTDSVAYCLKYIDKPGRIPQHSRDDRIPEFSRMSKGLGENYLSDEINSYHHRDLGIMYVTKLSGHKVPIPRYYRNKLFSERELKQQGLIVQGLVAELDMQKQRAWLHEHPGSTVYDYQKYIEAARYARNRNYYERLRALNQRNKC